MGPSPLHPTDEDLSVGTPYAQDDKFCLVMGIVWNAWIGGGEGLELVAGYVPARIDLRWRCGPELAAMVFRWRMNVGWLPFPGNGAVSH